MSRFDHLKKAIVIAILVGVCTYIYLQNMALFNIILVVCAIATLVIKLRETPFKVNTIVCLTGSPGSGKTLNGTLLAIKSYKRQNFLNKVNKLTFGTLALFIPKASHKAHIYSNVPICIGMKKKKPIFSEVLKAEHILMQEPLPEYCTVFIDEIGSFASQWDYDNPLVQSNLQIFIRFYRHFIGTERAGLVCTDQSADFIAKVIRNRIGIIVNMVQTRRAWRVLPLMRSYYVEMLAIDGASATTVADISACPYIARFVPYKWMRLSHKIYESRCYKYLYQHKAIRDLEAFKDYYTRYLIDLNCDDTLRKLYMKNKKAFLDSYLFES